LTSLVDYESSPSATTYPLSLSLQHKHSSWVMQLRNHYTIFRRINFACFHFISFNYWKYACGYPHDLINFFKTHKYFFGCNILSSLLNWNYFSSTINLFP
jgi:hypothetical protein